MGKRIAVITGASSGIGRCFALTAEKHGKFDELWAIARREDRLEELKSLVNVPVRPLPMDLTDRENLKKYAQLLETVSYTHLDVYKRQILGLVGANFLVELAVNIILSPTIVRLVKFGRKAWT